MTCIQENIKKFLLMTKHKSGKITVVFFEIKITFLGVYT